MKSTCCAALSILLVAALTGACSKEGAAPTGTASAAEPEAPAQAEAAEPAKAEPATAEPTTAEPTEAGKAAVIAPTGNLLLADIKTDGSLDEAIAEAKRGTITAVGASGKTRVVVPGQRTLAETETYTVRLEAPATASHDADVPVTLHVVPKTGWKINQEFPTKLTVTPPAGVVVAKATQGSKDAATFTEAAAAFAVGFRASDAGKKDFSAKLRFAVCTDATCDPKKEELAWAVDLK